MIELMQYLGFIFLIFLTASAGGPVFVALGKRFEHSIPVTCTVLVLILYIFGLFNRLYLGAAVAVAALCLLFALGIFLLVQLCRKAGDASPLKNLFTPAFFLFGALVLALAYFNYHRLVYASDELTHWADTVKAMCIHGVFGSEKIADTFYPEYPPGMSLFQFFFQAAYSHLISPVFREDLLFITYGIYVLSFFFPFFSSLNVKKPLCSLLKIIAVLICPLLYTDTYIMLFIDGALGILFGCGLARLFTDREKDTEYYIYILSIIASLLLFKASGLLFACFLAAIFLIDLFPQHTARSQKILLGFSCAALIAFLKLSWDTKVRTGGCAPAFTVGPDIDTIISLFLQKEGSYRQQVFNGYWPEFFQMRVDIGICEMSVFVFFSITLFILFLLGRQAVSIGRLKTMELKAMLIIPLLCMFIYAFGLCFAYVFSFPEDEALGYASSFRYLGSMYLAFWVLPVLFAAWLIEDIPEKRWRNVLPTVFLLVSLVVCQLPKNAKVLLFREELANSHSFRARTAQVEAVLAQESSPSNIYMVSAPPSGYDSALLHFVARPHSVTSLWNNEEERAPLMSNDEWRTLLIEEYDYVVVFVGDEVFIEEHGDLFEEPFVQGSTAVLYRVNKENGMLTRLTEIQP